MPEKTARGMCGFRGHTHWPTVPLRLSHSIAYIITCLGSIPGGTASGHHSERVCPCQPGQEQAREPLSRAAETQQASGREFRDNQGACV